MFILIARSSFYNYLILQMPEFKEKTEPAFNIISKSGLYVMKVYLKPQNAT